MFIPVLCISCTFAFYLLYIMCISAFYHKIGECLEVIIIPILVSCLYQADISHWQSVNIVSCLRTATSGRPPASSTARRRRRRSSLRWGQSPPRQSPGTLHCYFSYKLHLKQGQMPIRRGRNAPVTLTLSNFMFDWNASTNT